MNVQQFRVQAKAMGFDVRKRYGLEVLDIGDNGYQVCRVSYAELYHVVSAAEILAQKLPPGYKPPLG